jgi:non-specific serine/threonine protein kinase
MTNGQVIGRYRIIDKIGDGGVGSVFRAVDTRLGRVVALKFLRERWRHDESLRARFRREALIAASLNHPNICTVHDIEEADGRLFIVMERLRGRSLKCCVGAGGIGASAVVNVGVQVAGALAASHDRGVVHRDVKPANVFLCEDGVAKLLDFGVAKPAAAPALEPGPEKETEPAGDTGNGRLVGTVGYMSPEQTRGDVLDGRSDLFSLGVVLYEAATGVGPFDAPTSSTVFELLFSFDPPPPTCLNASLPKGFNRIVRKALSKSPAGRYQSAVDMRQELEAPDLTVGIDKPPVPPMLPAPRTPRLARSA